MNISRFIFITKNKKNIKSDSIFNFIGLLIILPLIYAAIIYFNTLTFESIVMCVSKNITFLLTYGLYLIFSLTFIMFGRYQNILVVSYITLTFYALWFLSVPILSLLETQELPFSYILLCGVLLVLVIKLVFGVSLLNRPDYIFTGLLLLIVLFQLWITDDKYVVVSSVVYMLFILSFMKYYFNILFVNSVYCAKLQDIYNKKVTNKISELSSNKKIEIEEVQARPMSYKVVFSNNKSFILDLQTKGIYSDSDFDIDEVISIDKSGCEIRKQKISFNDGIVYVTLQFYSKSALLKSISIQNELFEINRFGKLLLILQVALYVLIFFILMTTPIKLIYFSILYFLSFYAQNRMRSIESIVLNIIMIVSLLSLYNLL